MDRNKKDKNDDIINDYRQKCSKIVEKYIEFDLNSFNEEEFLADCRFITKNDFEDLIEERSTIDQCGYVLCARLLSQTTQKKFSDFQKYHLKNNRVFDITKRKLFCSDVCFEKAKYLLQQLSTEPIYLRKNTIKNEIKLCESTTGQSGDEIILNTHLFRSSKENISDIRKKEKPPVNLKNQVLIAEKKLSAPYLKAEELNELKDHFGSFKITENTVANFNLKQENRKLESNGRPKISHIIELNLNETKKTAKKQSETLSSEVNLAAVALIISKWMTSMTRNFLHISIEDHFDSINLRFSESDDNSQRKLERFRWEYLKLCAKLDIEELEDEKYDQKVLNENFEKNPSQHTQNKPSKSSRFKESIQENQNDLDENLQSRMKPFFSFDPFDSACCDRPKSVEKRTKKMVRFSSDLNDEDRNEMDKKGDTDDPTLFMPLNDNQHSHIKRKQILKKNIIESIELILQTISIDFEKDLTEINDLILRKTNELIDTFNFDSKSINFERKNLLLICLLLFRIVSDRVLPILIGLDINLLSQINDLIESNVLTRLHLSWTKIDECLNRAKLLP
ncbi:glyoxylate/hydroxypyruvate reductase [Sarcoptes scabiei]|nr:glyoxylate/hydroxypyruvate reductase [Sarcoptes scabiei]